MVSLELRGVRCLYDFKTRLCRSIGITTFSRSGTVLLAMRVAIASF
jgi:hypothetical protein